MNSSRLLHRLVTLLAALLLTAAPSFTFSTFHAAYAEDDDDTTVRAIDITGLTNTDRQTVKTRIYTQLGQPLDRSRLSEDIKRLFALGFFVDIQVAEQPHPDGGLILTFRLQERASILDVAYDIDGDSVDRDDLKKAVDLKPGELLDEARIQENLNKIRNLYTKEGHFLAETSYRLTPARDNRTRVTLVVREGAKVEVRSVAIVGNEHLDAELIKGSMQTREGSWLSFLTKAGEFDETAFDADLQRIQYLYLIHGYPQVHVGEPAITLAPDRRSMQIVIPVEEGPRYRVGKVTLKMVDGDWLVPHDDLMKRMNLKEGEWFDYSAMMADVAALGAAYRDRGYANANVSNEQDADPETRTFGVTFNIQKGDLVHIRRIEIRGNRDTRDKVVRREMKIDEGDLYSNDLIQLSRRRIMALGFFQPPTHPGDPGGVDIQVRPTNDLALVDLVVTVKEKQTGTFQIGAGFSSYESFLLTAQISKENIFGRGQTLSAQATLSGIRQLGSISFFEPYLFDTDVTFALDLFNYNEAFTDFNRLRQGGSLSFGYRLLDDLSLALTYTLESVDASLTRSTIDIERLRQSGVTSSLRGTLSYDTRDNRLFPTAGQYTTLSFEYAAAALGSENEFWRTIGRTRWYFPLFWDLILRLNGTVGIVQGANGQSVPLFERFFVGGIFTIRGFERNSIGERLYLAASPDADLSPINIGGNKELILNAEIEFPIFAEAGIRGVAFFDAGNAWGNDETVNLLRLRTAAGFGIRWNSPVGPLRFEWGFPLHRRPGEDSSVFEFTIGNSF